jgi:hypothetical protein
MTRKFKLLAEDAAKGWAPEDHAIRTAAARAMQIPSPKTRVLRSINTYFAYVNHRIAGKPLIHKGGRPRG